MRTKNKYGKIEFTESDIQFLKENFKSMKNQKIAEFLGLKMTVLRMKAYELGLQKLKHEYWSEKQTEFLKENYHRLGNKEIAEIFNNKFPNKAWTASCINRKMDRLKIKRTKLDLFHIKERNRDNGSFGNRNTKNNPKPPKIYFQLNEKTRIEIKHGKTFEDLKLKYEKKNVS